MKYTVINVANARLIGAAPDMLDALIQCIPVLRRAYETWGTTNDRNPERLAIELTSDAIYKATGEKK